VDAVKDDVLSGREPKAPEENGREDTAANENVPYVIGVSDVMGRCGKT
jgi:hypothetical protein